MPELPEAETIARGLRGTVLGETIRMVEVLRPDVLREAKRHFSSGLRGRSITAVERRGKNILLRLDTGLIAVNLGMTGRLLPFPTPPIGRLRPGHPAVRFRFTSGGILVFDDTRRFGTVERLTDADWEARSERMGPEPLGPRFTAEVLHERLQRSRSPVRSWLLDQRQIAGIGNIYANEALYLARVHPRQPARTLSFEQAQGLHAGLQHVLEAAIRAGGTTLRDYRTAEGTEGEFVRELQAYGKDGQPCRRCTTTVRRVVFGNRSAFFCPLCQPAPRG